jgi:rhomboid protease GluP
VTSEYDRPPLPIIARPAARFFWRGTWTGRIILFNALVFVGVCVLSRSIFMPDMQTLLSLGAKDPVGLARGEWWRFVTPVFLHIGIIHFAVNSYMLYQIGYQLESVLGAAWFLVVYLAAGVVGNVSSALFSPNLSAGASGALFGLLGAGFYIERSIGRRITEVTGRRPRRRVYAVTVLLNLVIGLVIPFIDNAAHLGGLVSGMLVTMAMMMIRPNRLQARRKSLGVALLTLLLAATIYGGYVTTTRKFAMSLILDAAESSGELDAKLHYAGQAYRLDPSSERLAEFVAGLAQELEEQGYHQEAGEVRRFFGGRPAS